MFIYQPILHLGTKITHTEMLTNIQASWTVAWLINYMTVKYVPGISKPAFCAKTCITNWANNNRECLQVLSFYSIVTVHKMHDKHFKLNLIQVPIIR